MFLNVSFRQRSYYLFLVAKSLFGSISEISIRRIIYLPYLFSQEKFFAGRLISTKKTYSPQTAGRQKKAGRLSPGRLFTNIECTAD
jgi:hypothetical protein